MRTWPLRKRALGVWVSLVIGSLAVSAAMADVRSTPRTWRPYDNPTVLITLGMTKGEVLIKAGDPDLQEVISIGTDGFQSVSAWTYVRHGHNAAVAILTFRGNRLVRIETSIVH